MNNSDLLFAENDKTPQAAVTGLTPWTILIVDDDPEVHQATMLSLSDVVCLGRPLKFLKAYSAAQAREILRNPADIAIILLDVVMESDDAGLQLVRYIRQDLNLHTTRIILRTGQPGSAPERDVIVEYDINDYKAKTELTDTRLFTTVVAALRGYRHLVGLETSRLGLRKVINAAASLHQSRSLDLFADGVLMQLSAILDSDAHSILCTQRRFEAPGGMIMLACSGRFRDLTSRAEELPLDAEIRKHVQAALETQSHVYNDSRAALYLRTPTEWEVVVYVECGRPFSELDLSLLEMFGQNISIGYDNLEIYRQVQDVNATLEQRVMERTLALTQSETHLRQFQSAVEYSSAAILITNREGVITYANPALSRNSQYSSSELLGRHSSMFRSEVTPDSIYDAMWAKILNGESWRGELLNRRKDGGLHWEDVSISPVTDANGEITHFVAVKDEISERKKLEAELQHLATIDPLTGLLNRRSFFALAEQEVSRARRHPGLLSVVMLDVDHFKSINDLHGHQAGDEVLRGLSEACGGCLRERDIMGRLGGEEFACVLPETSLEQAVLAAERLRAAVSSKKFRLADGCEIVVTISIGVAILQDTETSIDTVLHRADQALYRAKQAGRNCIRSTA
jgi:diguanylate cyclase (GGDEF)-like protein/PAS domain S-box-containing protein